MSLYEPDGYSFIRIETGDPGFPIMYKVVGSWSGGYTTGDSWRVNSGILTISKGDDEGNWEIHGLSGSTYIIHEKGRGLSGYAQGILNAALSKEVTQVTLDQIIKEFT